MIGTILNQRFSLEKELGRGGMGSVYHATDLLLQRPVAIKVLKELSGEEVGKRIRLEAQISARLVHDHIVRLYDFGISEGTYFLVMEEVEGTSFSKRWRKLGLTDRLRILAQVAEALDYAHHQGVIHRDVKPGNILLTTTDQAKLSDFGLSVLADEAHDSAIVRGTPHYMSPEQAKGRQLDHRTDLYALGVILYECTTGELPFQGPTMSILAQHVNTLPALPRSKILDYPEPLQQLVMALLAKDPEERPSSGHLVAEQLRAIREQERAVAEAPTIVVTPVPAPQSMAVVPTTKRDGAPPSRATGAAVAAPLVAEAEVPAEIAARTTEPLARQLLEVVEAEPIVLTPDERYLCGHYLAYLLGGSRRRGFWRKRPLDPLNADRARVMLGMASIMASGASDEAIARAAELLDRQVEVRAALSPIVVAKYLASRDTPAKRRKFRHARQRLQQASAHARQHLTDARGVLNPGLMPQVLDDLRRIAPPRTEVDDQLVERWNRVSEVWRSSPEFRQAVLRYATNSAEHDPGGALLWPEVVYPLIERARWQRQHRSRIEALWDNVCENLLNLPDAGTRLDRAIQTAVPERVVEELDLSAHAFEDASDLAEVARDEALDRDVERLTTSVQLDPISFEELASETHPTPRDLIRLTSPNPIRLTMGELREQWQEALAVLRSPGASSGHRVVPIGPYRLAVVASIRSRTAGQVVIQGMPNKQIELITPSFRVAATPTRPILAVWIYQDGSLVLTYLDNRNTQRYIWWNAATGQQNNYDDPAKLNHDLFQLSLEAPSGLSDALSKSFRPRKPV